jgi:hypothetical protein
VDGQIDALAVDASIARIAEGQYGVVSRAQLLGAGIGPDAVDFRLRAGRLHRLHRGVYAVGHRCLSREGRWMAAVLACGARAVLSHTTAASLWGLRGTNEARSHVTVATTAGLSQREGIVVHRSRGLRPLDVTRRSGIAVTTVARTLLDLAGRLPSGPLERAVEQALVLRLFDLVALHETLGAHPNRRGVASLGEIVARVDDEPSLTRSDAEALFLDLCDTLGIERPEVNSRVEDLEVDFAWRARRVVVEIDGHRSHGTRAAFERDRARDARLTVAGYRVVRFTYRQLVREPAAVAAIVLELLRPAYAASSSSRRPDRSASAVSR